MPLYQNKFQPYFPDPDSPNRIDCSGVYCHPIQAGDEIMTQFYQTPCGQNEIEDPIFDDITLGADIILNGTFSSGANWTVGANWLINAGTLQHTAGSTAETYQTAVPFTIGNTYQITFDVVRTAGSFIIRLGQTVGSTSTPTIDSTGSFDISIPYLDVQVGDNNLYFVPSTDFVGSIDNLVVKEITYNSWDLNASWQVGDGLACHIDGTTGLLEQSVANYININGYYELSVTATGVVAGECDVYVSDILVGTITTNGNFTYYTPYDDLPAVTGVVSFDPSSDFIGCISAPDLRELKIDQLAYLVDPDGVTEYDISEYFTYYERYVTLIFDINDLELPYDCYTIKVIDACVVEGDNLIANGDFSDGSDEWILNNGGGQYAFDGSTCELIFHPVEGSNYIDNGDFATGDFTDWTAGANWAVVANKAVHTAGSVATLVQSVTIPPPTVAPTPYKYWARMTMSGRTAGSVTVKLGDGTTSAALITNGIIMVPQYPTTSGAVNFTITPSTDFDGTLDDIELWYSNIPWSEYPILRSVSNTDMVAGNYEVEFEIISQSDPRIQVGIVLLGGAVSITYFDTVGVHTVSVPNYIPGAQSVRIVGKFQVGNYYIDGDVKIDNVVVRPVEPFEATFTSDCLNYQLEFTDTKMIVGYCDQNNLGFEFENTGFVLQQRVECRSFNSSYPSNVQIQKSGTGNARITYAEMEKYWRFDTDWVNETFHDCFAVQQKCDHLLIGPTADNGTEYIFTADEYQPEWRAEGDYNLAPVTGSLRIKTAGQVFNRHY